MFKRCFFLAILLLGLGLHAQESRIFKFPDVAEQITAISCEQVKDPNCCTYKFIGSKIKSVLEKYQRRIKRDTLSFYVELIVNPNGDIKRKRILFSLENDALTKKFKDHLDNALSQESFIVANYNDGVYPSSHNFNYRFLVEKKNKVIKPLPVAQTYSGGVVQLIPLFPNSSRHGDELDMRVFNKNMQDHIRKNFRYPSEAIRRRIQGVTNVMFTIDKRGRVTDVRVQSPHPLLGAESRRIISLLPVFKAGIQDGRLAEIPFCIPITFRLK